MTQILSILFSLTLLSSLALADTTLVCKHEATLDDGEYESEYTFEFSEHPNLLIDLTDIGDVNRVAIGAMDYDYDHIVSVDQGNENGEMVVVVSGQEPLIPQIEVVVSDDKTWVNVNRITDLGTTPIALFRNCEFKD